MIPGIVKFVKGLPVRVPAGKCSEAPEGSLISIYPPNNAPIERKNMRKISR